MNGPGIFKVSVEVPDRKDAHCCDVPAHVGAYLRRGRCCGLAVGTTTRSAAPDPGGTAKIGKASDFNEESRVIAPLEKKLKNRFGMGNAGLQGPSGGLRASACHIKVAVRDSKAVWLSSGNWQLSNQPDVPPFAAGARKLPAGFQSKYNRDLSRHHHRAATCLRATTRVAPEG
jgi:hypothetical protein